MTQPANSPASPVDTRTPVGMVRLLAGDMDPQQFADDQIQAQLDTARIMLRGRFPDIDTRAAADPVVRDSFTLAAVNMVSRLLRAIRNPAGLQSTAAGPFSRTFDTKQPTQLVVTAAEEQLLTPTPPAGAVAAGTIRLRPGLAAPPVGIHHWGRHGRW